MASQPKSRFIRAAMLVRQSMKKVVAFLIQPPFFMPAFIIVVVFCITRLPFFVNYPIVEIWPDTASYPSLAKIAERGYWPLFNVRTPGYPLFIWATTLFVKGWRPVIAMQNLLSLLSCLCLAYGVYRLRSSLALPAALAISGFLGSSQIVIYDTSALSDSVYTSAIIFAFAFLLLAFAQHKSLYFGLASGAMASAILVRPSGMFFMVIYALVLAYLLWNRYERNAVVALALPLPIILLLLCVYNYMTLKQFVISPWGDVNIADATILYWEPDNKFDSDINAVLAELPKALSEKVGFTSKDRRELYTSWNLPRLEILFGRGYSVSLGKFTGLVNFFEGKSFSENSLLSNSAVREISFLAIKKHPEMYLKFIMANEWGYFESIDRHYDLYADMIQEANRYHLADEYADSVPPGAVQIVRTGNQARIVLADTPLKRLHETWQAFHWAVFQHVFWVWAYFVVLVLKFSSTRAFSRTAFGRFYSFCTHFGCTRGELGYLSS